MRRRGGLKWVLGLVLVGGAVFGACKLRSGTTQSSALTQVVAVTRGNLTATVSPTGQVASQQQVELAFDVNRLPVTEVLVVSGQEVKKGDVLVKIDPSSLERAVEQAEASLLSAEESLEKAKEPYSALDQQKARLDVAQAEAALAEVSQDDPAELVKQAESSLASARLNLTLTTSGTSAGKAVRDLQYTVAWHERNVNNLRAQHDQGKATTDEVTEAEQNLSMVQAQLSAAEATARTSISVAQTKVTEAEKALDDLLAGSNSVALADRNNKVAQAEYNLAKAKDSLAKMEAGADAKTVQLAQARYDAAKATLDQARTTLESAAMVAPFDGTVTSVGVAVGDLVSSGTRVVTLADLSKLEVVATVDETEISQVKVGQNASITFDALSGVKFTGKVVEVPLAGQLVQNVVSYDVVLSLEGSGGESLLPGMTANVTIVTGQKQNVLLLPALAIAQDDSGDVVTLEGSNETVPVQVGLSNGTYVEVVRGLNEGDKVVIAYSSTSSDSMRFPGAGMGVMVEMSSGGSPPQSPPEGR